MASRLLLQFIEHCFPFVAPVGRIALKLPGKMEAKCQRERKQVDGNDRRHNEPTDRFTANPAKSKSPHALNDDQS